MTDSNSSDLTGVPNITDNSTQTVQYTAGFLDLPGGFLMPSRLWSSRLSGMNNADSPLPEDANSFTNSPAAMVPASDLLVITPQMLVDYFKPGQSPTNAANVSVLVPVGFTPAIPATTPASDAADATP